MRRRIDVDRIELDLRGTGVTREAIAAWKSSRSGRRALR